MSGSHLPLAFAPDDYAAIAAAMQESARGRWFLAEFAARAREADTRVLLDAVRRLEGVAGGAAGPHGSWPAEVAALAESIARAKDEVARLGAGDAATPGAVADGPRLPRRGVVHPRAVDAAEDLQDLAWAFRERGAAPETCDALDRQAAAIHAVAAGEDRALRRTRRLVRLLRDLEARLAAMADRSGLAFPAGPAWPDDPGAAEGPTTDDPAAPADAQAVDDRDASAPAGEP